jgi:hypothetical protein
MLLSVAPVITITHVFRRAGLGESQTMRFVLPA